MINIPKVNISVLFIFSFLIKNFLVIDHNTVFASSSRDEMEEEKHITSYSCSSSEAEKCRGTKRSFESLKEEKGKEKELESKKLKDHNGEIQKIKTELNIIDDLSRAWVTRDKVNIIVGNTGAGKSTVFDYVIGEDLVAKYSRGEIIIERKNEKARENDERGRIGFGASSCTKYPQCSGEYFDCPGFGDSRGYAQDIVNGYSLFKLFSRVNSFELTVVADIQQLNVDRGISFVNLISQIERLFPVKVDEIKHGISLVITKWDDISSDVDHRIMAIGKIKDILNERRGTLGFTRFQEDFMNYIVNDGAQQILFFNRPSNEGLLRQGSINLRRGHYIENIKPCISVSDNTKRYIRGLADSSIENILNLVSMFFNDIDISTNSIIKQYTSDAAGLRKFFASNLEDLEVLIKSKKVEDHIYYFTNVLNNFNSKNTEQFKINMDHLNFLINIDPSLHDHYYGLNQQGIISQVIKFINPLAEAPTRHSTSDGTPFVKGDIVGTSDVARLFLDSPSKFALIAKRSLLFDNDIFRPGVSIACIAPLWIIIGKRSFSIAGKDCDQELLEKAKNGEAGVPGYPGQSGGSFYGMVGNIYSIDDGELTINTSGGQGGKGQDGGDGIKGQDGTNGNLKLVESRDKECRVDKQSVKGNPYLQYLKAPLVANKSKKYFYKSGTKGKNGGDSGIGGQGGYGGKAGFIYFYDTRNSPQSVKHYKGITIVNKDGDAGLDGKPGTPGKGGRNGAIYKGVYVHNALDEKKYVKSALTQSGLYAAIGGSAGMLGGPIVAGAASLIGCGAGFAAPYIGSLVADFFTGGWEKKPSKATLSEFMPDGSVPSGVNKQGIENPAIAPIIEIEKLHCELIK